jgi:hypothetical protein
MAAAWSAHGRWLNTTIRAPRSAAASTESGDMATQKNRSRKERAGAGLMAVRG